MPTSSCCRYGVKNSGGMASFTSLYLASCTSADDLDVQRRRRRALFMRLADRVAAEVELLREGLVHDRHLGRAEHVGAREVAPGQQRHADVLK